MNEYDIPAADLMERLTAGDLCESMGNPVFLAKLAEAADERRRHYSKWASGSIGAQRKQFMAKSRAFDMVYNALGEALKAMGGQR